MKNWPIQDAKNQLSHVVELARTKGPQTITKHGKPVVVMVSVEQFKKRQEPKETAFEFFSRFMGAGIKWERNKEMPRVVEL
jgi:antitoxin Phd